ncbi:MAG: bifunctional phosphoribosyl-AMP cyclohydrolase/phosphoribosyl-ATP diphosphatase HisIE [Acidobacteria bacterium]|jgi:phosphoribosyl-ATP pyrophosphohydrolase/phosphoribosyl-AMP cyclohydrolase|nr:MAG: bifunctional phosphoribosyl-AMP cyclohydrolase/phosphoribosyl-ATP diphosphatase HisIE [Acidobacteriota bacterium]GIU81068.1 MAG: histidine biosynthesis bifunctional protein HisIE [Pyrinomonadaceae bacterium]
MKIDFEKYADRLVPAIVQDFETEKILMLGFMNSEALKITQETGKATFYSRSRQKIWTKGETSGNFLYVRDILIDCDADTILLKVNPSGSVCHTGADTCFGESNTFRDFLFELERIVKDRKENPKENSYTCKLFSEGLDKIAQKLGEEAVELIIEAKNDEKERFKAEAADLLYHFILLLSAKNVTLAEVLETLKQRRK